jgi:hypothetical protein
VVAVDRGERIGDSSPLRDATELHEVPEDLQIVAELAAARISLDLRPRHREGFLEPALRFETKLVAQWQRPEVECAPTVLQ